MKSGLKASCALALVLLAGAPVSAQQQTAAVGVNAAIRNVVQMKTARDAALRPAVLRETVSLGDQVASGANSALQVLLRDKSVFSLGSNARMTIDRFVYDPNRGTGEMAASIARGAFRFMSGKARAGASRTIQTPVASIGVRGTIVEGAVGPEVAELLADEPSLAGQLGGNGDNATLVALRGPGPATQGQDKVGEIDVTSGGQTVTIDTPGEAILVVGDNQPPIGPFPLPQSVSDNLIGAVKSQPGEAPGAAPGGPNEPVEGGPPPIDNANDVPAAVEFAGPVGTDAVELGPQLPATVSSAEIVVDPVTTTDLPITPATDPQFPCPPGRFCPQ